MRKMLNIMNHYGIESQNIMKYHLAPVKIAIARKTRSNTVGKEKEKKKKKKSLFIDGESVHWYSHYKDY